MDGANLREAMREIEADIEEGADMIMVKPAMPYLDVIAAARERFDSAAGRLSGVRRIRHDRSRRAERLDRTRPRHDGVAAQHPAGGGKHYFDVLREGRGEAAGVGCNSYLELFLRG